MSRNVSNCCGAGAKPHMDPHGGVDCDDEDLGLCSRCGDYCLYITQEQYDREIEEAKQYLSCSKCGKCGCDCEFPEDTFNPDEYPEDPVDEQRD